MKNGYLATTSEAFTYKANHPKPRVVPERRAKGGATHAAATKGAGCRWSCNSSWHKKKELQQPPCAAKAGCWKMKAKQLTTLFNYVGKMSFGWGGNQAMTES